MGNGNKGGNSQNTPKLSRTRLGNRMVSYMHERLRTTLSGILPRRCGSVDQAELGSCTWAQEPIKPGTFDTFEVKLGKRASRMAVSF